MSQIFAVLSVGVAVQMRGASFARKAKALRCAGVTVSGRPMMHQLCLRENANEFSYLAHCNAHPPPTPYIALNPFGPNFVPPNIIQTVRALLERSEHAGAGNSRRNTAATSSAPKGMPPTGAASVSDRAIETKMDSIHKNLKDRLMEWTKRQRALADLRFEPLGKCAFYLCTQMMKQNAIICIM